MELPTLVKTHAVDGLVVVKVNVLENPKSKKTFKLRSVFPVMIFYNHGKLHRSLECIVI